MATEYHNRLIQGRRLSWRVDRLREVAKDVEPTPIALASIFEFDEVYWFDGEHRPTCRAVVDHVRRIQAADLTEPIILSPDGWVVDGMHRIAKAFMSGLTEIKAIRLPAYPDADRSEEANPH